MLQTLAERWNNLVMLRAGAPEEVRQAGAIPYTLVDGQPVFLLITSRRTGRWIYPKGAPIDDMRPWEVAAHEAFEEAGIEGDIETTPIGSYRTIKHLGIRRSVIEVDMYPLRLIRQLDDWREKGYRHRHWAILPEARRLLSEQRLVELTELLNRRLRASV
jgi:8-oxo-dGTP pyrophosphatase MutT (NUDIX family)